MFENFRYLGRCELFECLAIGQLHNSVSKEEMCKVKKRV